MWSFHTSGTSSIMSSSDYDSSQGSILVSSETSTVPSRLDSFSSSNGAVPCNDFNMQTSFDFDDTLAAIPTSPLSSVSSSRDRQGGIPQGLDVTSASNSTTDHSTADNAEIEELESVEAERAVSPTIQKWVDESCVETQRLKSAGKFSGDVAIKDEEMDEEEVSPPSDFALQQALEYSLRAVSPSFARTASLDGGFSALSDYQSQLTPTETMLLGLGFGGPDLGIPVRFLKSWREQVIKRKIMELQGLLGRSQKSPSPTGSARQYAVKSPRGGESPRKKKSEGESSRKKKSEREAVPSPDNKAVQNTSQRVPSPKTVVKPSEKQLQLEKLKEMRQKLWKSATISSFSPSSLPDPNQLFSGKDMKKKGAMSEKKYQKFRGATRGNAKDRRRKFGTRQSSLPISLETLPEEDEGRPAFLQQKSSSFDFVDNLGSSNNTSTANSASSSKLDIREEGTEDNVVEGIHQMEGSRQSHPTITVMSEPCDDPDQRLLSMPEIEKNQERGNSKTALDGKHLLAIKGIIESKDSGFGNEISNEGTPQLSPEHCSRKSCRPNGKDELSLQECPENKLCSGRLVPDGEGKNFLTKQSDDKSNTKTEMEEKKKQLQRVDLCIQVDLPEVTTERCSDVEYSSAGVQTSPWLESGELSPLCCGQFTYNLNESSVDPSEGTDSHEKGADGENLSQHTLTAGDSLSQGQKGSSQDSAGTSEENTIQGVNTSEGARVKGENIPSEPCGDVVPRNPKTDSTDNSLFLKEPGFFEGFNAEKRRLSRIEEGTETTLSHQSEEGRPENSFESQLDSSSSQTTSTSSSTRPSSSLVLLSADAPKLSEDTGDVNSVKKTQSHSKKVMKQIYKEMLERNLAGDLSNEKDLLHLRTSYQAERSSTKLTVDETLLKAAQKLEMCARDQDLGASEEAAVSEGTNLAVVEEKEKESIPSKEIAPTNAPASQPEDSSHLHSKSIVSSPNDQSGSQQSRRFFSSQSFSSFTDAIKEVQRSRTNSNISDALDDFERDSFFSAPDDVDVFKQDPDVNFSLTGSDMNLMSGDEVDRLSLDNPEVASRFVTISDELSLEEMEDNYLGGNENRKYLKDFLHSYSRNHYNNMISTISSVESGAFFSETINDEVSLGKETFTQSLEIKVSRPSSRNPVFLSHHSILLSRKDSDKGLHRLLPMSQEEQNFVVKVPFNYSSKYYFSVEDYTQCSDEESENLIHPLDQLSRRRQSLINAHLAARGHVFDEVIDEVSLYETENGRRDDFPLMITPGDETTGAKVSNMLRIESFGEDNGVVTDGIAKFRVEDKRNGRVEKIERYSRRRKGSDKMSGESDLSPGSSISSSKVDQYVDLMLENTLQEVRLEEFTIGGADFSVHKASSDGEDKGDGVCLSPNCHDNVTGNNDNGYSWNQMENGQKPHRDPDFGGQIEINVSQNCDSFNPVSQSNKRIDMGNRVLDDRINHMVSSEDTLEPVELDGLGEALPASVSTFNDEFLTFRSEKGQEKVSSDRSTVDGIRVQNLTNGVGVAKHSEESWLMTSDGRPDLPHNSSVDCIDKRDNETKSSTSSSHSVWDANDKKVTDDCNRAIISVGVSKGGSVHNGLHCQETRDNLGINQREDSLNNSGEKTTKALAKGSELMPSYEELYSKAESLISNLDALIAGNK